MVPAAGCWAKHGAVDYEPRFFQALAGAAGYEIMNLSLHRPAYQWSSDEVRTFWELLDDLLARESLTLPEEIVPEMISIMPHLDKSKQANVLSVFRKGPRDFFDKEVFLQLPGIHWKSTKVDGECLQSSKLWVTKQCEEQMTESDSCSMLQ